MVTASECHVPLVLPYYASHMSGSLWTGAITKRCYAGFDKYSSYLHWLLKTKSFSRSLFLPECFLLYYLSVFRAVPCLWHISSKKIWGSYGHQTQKRCTLCSFHYIAHWLLRAIIHLNERNSSSKVNFYLRMYGWLTVCESIV